MDGSDVITTARLVLRRPRPSDVEPIRSLHADPRTTTHNPSDRLATAEDAADLYRRWDDHWRRFGYGYWAVCYARRDEPIGFCGLKRMRFQNRDVLNLFCRLVPSVWNHGVGSEATSAVAAWAAQHAADVPLVARVRPGNAASHRVAVRAGLERASHLDEPGEDGIDCIYVARWRAAPE